MIPTGMPDASIALTPDFFVNPRCPPGSSSVLPAADPAEIFGEDLPAKDIPAAKGGVDISSGPLTGPDKEPKVVTEGYGLKSSFACRVYSLCGTFYYYYYYFIFYFLFFIFFGRNIFLSLAYVGYLILQYLSGILC